MNEFTNKIYQGDGLKGMEIYPNGSIDMILCDLPYGMTDCKWDSCLDFSELWEQYERVIKPNGAIVLTSSQPFTTKLIQSNKKLFRYCWYWQKNISTGFAFSKYQPLRCMEDICVFYKRSPTYNPQGVIFHEKPLISRGRKSGKDCVYKSSTLNKDTKQYYSNYPKNLLQFKCERGLHPTQKPVALFEYLIRTYTQPGETVLDNCIGSGTTAIACMRSGRNFTGFEIDRDYYMTAQKRIADELSRAVK